MAKKISISPAEWEVMQPLWRRAPLELSELIAGLPQDRPRSHQIIRTMLLRLEKKGAVTVDRSEKNFKYSPAVSQEICVSEEVAHFLSRVFDGSASGLVLSLAKSGQLSKKERAEILHIIESIEEEE